MTPATGVRVLLSEGSSLTAREFISVLGPMGYRIEVMDPNRACQARWSRWVRHVHPCPPAGIDPLGYLHAVREVLLRGRFHVLLPTHEQAWLFAIARNRLPTAIGLAVAAPHAFAAVQSKIDFARLLDEMALPQPSWTLVASAADLPDWPAPYYLKTAYSTAGQGVRRVPTSGEAASALRDLLTMSQGHPVMAQRAAPGRYGQVQGLFRHGQMIAVHTSTQTAIGIGPSAAGRESTDHPLARDHAAVIGHRLGWHGGLTLDYFFDGPQLRFIECNPRTVEPANAARSGINLPAAQIALSLDEPIEVLPPGRAGVRTHSALAVLLGTADRVGTRPPRSPNSPITAASSPAAPRHSPRFGGTHPASSRSPP